MHIYTQRHIHTHTHIYIYIYMAFHNFSKQNVQPQIKFTFIKR